MRILSGEEEKIASGYMKEAVKSALKSSCLKSKCGTVIVKDGKIIGRGFNSPPKELESQRKCLVDKKDFDDKVGDKSCCIHAEQRAIMDCLKNNADKINGSSLYFIRLDMQGNMQHAGKPYCTYCSKLALDVGISEFLLWHEKGICAYDTEEYNHISFQYKSD